MSLIVNESHSFIPIEWPDLPSNIRVLSTTRLGGVSKSPYDDGSGQHGLNLGDHVGDDAQFVLQNRAIVQQYMLTTPLAFLNQVHGTSIIDVSDSDRNQNQNLTADGCYSRSIGSSCVVLTADCLPVLMCDLSGSVVAALHAGWRGLASGILQKGVHHCRQQGGQELTAWLGPAIGPRQFEVGQDVKDAFILANPNSDLFFVSLQKPQKYLADIYGLAKLALQSVGVHRIYGGQYCTMTQSDQFYSYRRDGVTGRMAHIIWREK